MDLNEFKTIKPGDLLWYKTGNFTASRVKVLSTDGVGATSRVWVDVIDQMRTQPRTTGLNRGKGLPVSYRMLTRIGAR
jgi:hypothetical protein